MRKWILHLFLYGLYTMIPENIYAKQKSSHCACSEIPTRFAPSNVKQTITAQNHIAPEKKDLRLNEKMAYIPSGSLLMGGDNNQAKPDELPKHLVKIRAFWLDKTEVTNQEFSQFVESTQYQTTAEKKPDWKELKKQLPPDTPTPDETLLVPASLVFTPPDHPVQLDNIHQWWSWVPGANWQHPRGRGSDIAKLTDHPVVQVSWYDARAYCRWLGKRLPSEAEWEWAARGGFKNNLYPWGNEPVDTGKVKANTWQGKFPYQNMLRDGYYYTSPVKTYAPNQYGLYDMAGNVWEWVNDWYRNDYYQEQKNQRATLSQGPLHSFDPDDPYAPKKVLEVAHSYVMKFIAQAIESLHG